MNYQFLAQFFPQKVVNLGKLSSCCNAFRKNSSTLHLVLFHDKNCPLVTPYALGESKKAEKENLMREFAKA